MNQADDISQAERRRVLENDRLAREGSTYHNHAVSSANDLMGGRFGVDSKSVVIGSSPISYPRIPSGPWSGADIVPPEQPLGYAIDQQEPTGEIWEQAASSAPTARVTGDDADAPTSLGDSDRGAAPPAIQPPMEAGGARFPRRC
jgi:hypothetical protein